MMIVLKNKWSFEIRITKLSYIGLITCTFGVYFLYIHSDVFRLYGTWTISSENKPGYKISYYRL